MANASALRCDVAEVSRRLLALRAESVGAGNAVQILIAESTLPPQAGADPQFPLSSAIGSIISLHGPTKSSMSIADYVRICELNGKGDSALELLSRPDIKRKQGRMPLGVIGVELVLLTLVLSIYSIFVFPQLKA
ncbi:hypothetical protein, partial [Dokdonella sp.]|uniref:hypothetical protein n=1 Tax=Dokdonella sp. TaxID=2291710 RepID=UPI003C4F9CD2